MWPIATAVLIWSVNLCVLFACGELPGKLALENYGTFGLFLTIGLHCFSVAWLVSALQDSPTYAVASGIVTPLAIGLCFGAVNWLTDGNVLKLLYEGGVVAAYVAIILAVAVASFIGGCWYYLRRVEP